MASLLPGWFAAGDTGEMGWSIPGTGRNGGAVETLEGQSRSIQALAFTANGDVVSGRSEQLRGIGIRLLNVAFRRSASLTRRIHDASRRSPSAPDGKQLATGSGEHRGAARTENLERRWGGVGPRSCGASQRNDFRHGVLARWRIPSTCAADRFVRGLPSADGSFVKSFERAHSPCVGSKLASGWPRSYASSGPTR
jgi:hypothetical protein